MKGKQELVRKIVKVGNSAGVILPKEWYGGEAKIELVVKPLDIKSDILKILSPYLSSVLGIYLVGSYARNEQEERSDVDVLVITSDIDKRIKAGKYDILMVSKEKLHQILERNITPLLPMIKEAKTILNSILIKEYLGIILNRDNLKFHIETTKSAMGVVRAELDLCREEGEKFVSDAGAYSLILRLRGSYIVECLIDKKEYNNKNFIALVQNIAGSKDAYDGYLRVKDETGGGRKLSLEEAERLYDYVVKKIIGQERWAKRKK